MSVSDALLASGPPADASCSGYPVLLLKEKDSKPSPIHGVLFGVIITFLCVHHRAVIKAASTVATLYRALRQNPLQPRGVPSPTEDLDGALAKGGANARGNKHITVAGPADVEDDDDDEDLPPLSHVKQE